MREISTSGEENGNRWAGGAVILLRMAENENQFILSALKGL